MSYTRKKSKQQEQSIAKDIGGKVQKASGATDFAKGDVRGKGLRVEAKTTSAKSYSLKLSEITKIQAEALTQDFEAWAMQIQFQGQLGHAKKVAVIDWDTYVSMREEHLYLEERLKDLKNEVQSLIEEQAGEDI